MIACGVVLSLSSSSLIPKNNSTLPHLWNLVSADLVAREQAGLSEAQRRDQRSRNLQAEVERLRKEGSSLLEREQALLREELARQAREERLKSATNNTGRSSYCWLKTCLLG